MSVSTASGASGERMSARMATASADAPTFFVVRVAISHFLCRPVWSTYDNVLRLSHRVVPTCVEPVIFALDSLLVSIEPCENANALVPPASVEQASSARRRANIFDFPGNERAPAGRGGDRPRRPIRVLLSNGRNGQPGTPPTHHRCWTFASLTSSTQHLGKLRLHPQCAAHAACRLC